MTAGTANGRVRKKRNTIALLLCLIAEIVVLISLHIAKANCNPDPLAGVWKLDDTTVYQFDGRGSGALCTAVDDYSFSYRCKGSNVVLTFGEEKTGNFVYSFEKNEAFLTLTSEQNGKSYILSAVNG